LNFFNELKYYDCLSNNLDFLLLEKKYRGSLKDFSSLTGTKLEMYCIFSIYKFAQRRTLTSPLMLTINITILLMTLLKKNIETNVPY